MRKNHIKVFMCMVLFFIIVIFPIGCCNYKGRVLVMQSAPKINHKVIITHRHNKCLNTFRRSRNRSQCIVKVALTQIGKPYVWGGNSPVKGFDCSGLVWWVFKQNGLNLPKVSYKQKIAGKSILRKELRKGDLVLFKTNPKGRSLHVGIYVGKGMFIHSPKKGSSVRLDSVSNPYWQRVYVCARRVVP